MLAIRKLKVLSVMLLIFALIISSLTFPVSAIENVVNDNGDQDYEQIAELGQNEELSDTEVNTPAFKEVYSSGKSIIFKWNAVSGAYGYKLFYKNGTSWKTIATTTGTTYSWTGAVFGTTYVFTLRCIDRNGNFCSDYDKTGHTFRFLAGMPVVTDVTSKNGKIDVSWNAVAGVSRFKVFYKNGTSWKTIATVDGTSYSWGGAVIGNTYVFTVRCVDSNNNFISDYDNIGYSYRYLADTPIITNVLPSGDYVNIMWDSVYGISNYRVFYKNGTSWKNIGNTTTNSFTFKTPVYGTKYVFTVRCLDANGSFISDYDSNGYVYTYMLNTPVINEVVKDGYSATFSWKNVTGGSRYRFFEKSGTSWKGIGYTNTNSFKVSNLKLNEKKTYTVRCVNSNNSFISDYNKTGYSFTLSYDTPKISKITLDGGKAHISWGEVKGSPRYRLFYKNGTSWKTIATVSGTSYDFPMSYNETKTFTVRCCDANGNFISGYDSNGFKFTYKLDTPKIKSVTALNIEGAAVKLSWNAVNGAAHYRVFYKNGSSWAKIADTDTNSFNWYFVEPNTSYTYTVRCVDSSGNFISDYDSTGYTFKLTTSYLRTPKVSSVTSTSNGTAVNIAWKAVPGAQKYRVFYKDGSSWKTIGDTTSTSYTWKNMTYNKAYTYTVRCMYSSGGWQSYYDTEGVTYTLVFVGDALSIPKGKAINKSKSGVYSWKSSNTKIAKVNSLGIIEGVSEGSCTVTGGSYSYNIVVTSPEPVRVAYVSPNSAEIGDNVSLIAITDMDKTAVKFNVGSTTVEATSKTTDYCRSDSSYKVYVWTAKYKVTSSGVYSVTAYSKTANTSWATCSDAKTEIFVMKDRDAEVCEERRVSDDGINFIAICEGLIDQIEDDTLAPGNFTVGYGRVIYQGQTFYNNLSPSQAYAYLVETVNTGLYTTKTNSVLLNNKSKFKQQHFDALASLVYNLGTGIYSDSDLSTLCKLSNLSKATKKQVVNAFCDYHHASGMCINGLLTRRVDECEIFLIGDYTRDYGNKNRCGISYSCSRGISFP